MSNDDYEDDFVFDQDNYDEDEAMKHIERKPATPFSLITQDTLATHMYRVIEDAEAQGFFMDMFSNWSRNDVKTFESGVMAAHLSIGNPVIDYQLIDSY